MARRSRLAVMAAEVVALAGGLAYLAYFAYQTLSVAGPGLLNPLGRSLGSDFVQYWATSALALAGEPTPSAALPASSSSKLIHTSLRRISTLQMKLSAPLP